MKSLTFRKTIAGFALACTLAGCGTSSGASDSDLAIPDPKERLPSERDLAEGELLATYYPTPDAVVDRLLDLADVQAGERFYDLGSGDGKLVIQAAAERGARAVGFEIDRELVDLSRRRIAERGLDGRAQIREQDLLEADFSGVDVVTVFLTPEGLESVAPKLASSLEPGTRVVSYKFPIPDWEPDETEEIDDGDPETPLHHLYLYRR